jgi:hypothetical protein
MYPQRDLSQLSLNKARLRMNIALDRNRCVVAAARATQPLQWIDHAQSAWRQFSPIARMASLPLAAIVTRAVFPRSRILRTLVRWGPLVTAIVRTADAAITRQKESERGIQR